MNKLSVLKKNLGKLDQLLVAYSGGVDSSFLMAVAHEVLGPDRVQAIFVASPLNPQRDRYEAHVVAEMNGWKIKTVSIDPWENKEISGNGRDRCYFCKKTIFEKIGQEALALGYSNIADGSNFDDLDDIRPGMKALDELNIVSPLLEAKLTKDEIRLYSKEVYDLPTWNKPSAACLASRIPYDTELTEDNLRMVDEAENFLHGLGYRGCRARYHDKVCRIELNPNDFDKFMAQDREVVQKALEEIGFVYVALDIVGYRMGATNLVLEEK